MTSEIRYSRALIITDAYPVQITAQDFDEFRDAVLGDRSEVKGETYICAPMKTNSDGRAQRGKDYVLPSRFIPFDFDGMGGMAVQQQLIDHLSQYLGFGYTTASHTDKDPYLRVVLAASRELTRIELQQVCKALQQLIKEHPWSGSIKFDESVYRSEQALYTPLLDAETYRFEGDVVDVDEVLKTAPGIEEKSRVKDRAALATSDDPILKALDAKGLIKSLPEDGRYNIECPFAHEHTSESGESSTIYYLPNSDYRYGKFYCHHDHCSERKQEDFINGLGLNPKKVWKQQIRNNERGLNSSGDSPNFDSLNQIDKSKQVQASMAPPKKKIKEQAMPIADGAPPPPKELLKPPGLIGEMAAFIDQQSTKLQPILAVASAFTALAFIQGNRYVIGPMNSPLQPYINQLAPTGEGKESQRSGVRALVHAAEINHGIPESVASGPALLRALASSNDHNLLCMIDEFGRKLQHASPDRDSHQHSFVSEVMSLFGRGTSMFGGKNYANGKQTIEPFPCPFLLLMASSTHEEMMKALNGGDVHNGSINRLILVESREGIAPWQDDADSTMSTELKDKLKHMASGNGAYFEALEIVEKRERKKCPKYPDPKESAKSKKVLSEITRFRELTEKEQKKWKVQKVGFFDREFTVIKMHKGAEAILLKFRNECDKCKIADVQHGDLWARGWHNALMIAGLLAVGVRPGRPVVTKELARYAVTFIRWSIECWVYRVGTEVAENVDHANQLKVLRIIKEAKKYAKDKRWGKWCRQGLMPHGKALKTSRLNKRQFGEVIDTLIEQGDVIVEEHDNAGGTTTILYRYAS